MPLCAILSHSQPSIYCFFAICLDWMWKVLLYSSTKSLSFSLCLRFFLLNMLSNLSHRFSHEEQPEGGEQFHNFENLDMEGCVWKNSREKEEIMRIMKIIMTFSTSTSTLLLRYSLPSALSLALSMNSHEHQAAQLSSDFYSHTITISPWSSAVSEQRNFHFCASFLIHCSA